MQSTLPNKIGAAIWHNLNPETKWRLIKASTAVLSKAAVRSITRDSKKVAFLVLAVTLIGAFLMFRRNSMFKVGRVRYDV